LLGLRATFADASPTVRLLVRLEALSLRSSGPARGDIAGPPWGLPMGAGSASANLHWYRSVDGPLTRST
jgi:hypothetical protein